MRPRFHFTAPRGWINDPHGITFRDGRYHLFFQFNPDSSIWRPDCRWGHAVSPDLFSFELLPDALLPGDGDDGIWTGSLVVDDDGAATIFYTSVTIPDVGLGRVRTARPADDKWLTWTKGAVVVEPPAGVTAFRDPFLRRDTGTGTWQMFVGTSISGSAAASAFVSSDLAEWRPAGVVASRAGSDRDPVWTGSLWECPQIFELDGRDVLVTSVWEDDELYYCVYAVGRLRGGEFVAESWGRLTYGDSYYAPSYFRDADGRACLMFWLRGIEGDGWAGAHSVPHVLRLEGERLVASPHPALEGRRAAGGIRNTVDGLGADLLWETGSRLVITSDAQAVATVSVRGRELELVVGGSSWEMPFTGGAVRLVLDGPLIEVSVADGLVAAAIRPDGTSLAFEGDGTLCLFAVL
ncbi:MAG TPA: glycoside hydrolase family 32 protein [Pseudolysinimonas sp.]|nr:glycoside hydrolase family 32 protein [Pseudolysinimonas sp.]